LSGLLCVERIICTDVSLGDLAPGDNPAAQRRPRRKRTCAIHHRSEVSERNMLMSVYPDSIVQLGPVSLQVVLCIATHRPTPFSLATNLATMASTTDRRRILGPERSYPPVYAPLDSTPSTSGSVNVNSSKLNPSKIKAEDQTDSSRPLCGYSSTGFSHIFVESDTQSACQS
jgi:hypothetical protein